MSESSSAVSQDTPPYFDPPQMSEISTIAGIFFEPGKTFEDLRRKPRFIIASVIIALLVTAYGFGMYYKIGEAGMRRVVMEQMDKSSQTQSMSNEQKADAVDLQVKIQNGIRYAIPVFIFISLLIGGLLYFLGSKAFGGNGGFMHGLSVWVYSSLPPTVIGMLGSFVVMAFKSVDDIDVASSQRGLLNANPSLLIDGTTQPVLATVLATLDVFFIWGWILAAIGLRITNKLSSGSAWGIVIIFAIIGTLFRIIGAIFSGTQT
jgi:hypothetical protein